MAQRRDKVAWGLKALKVLRGKKLLLLEDFITILYLTFRTQFHGNVQKFIFADKLDHVCLNNDSVDVKDAKIVFLQLSC